MTPPDPESVPAERSLVNAARQGDRAALEQLLQLHFDRVHALCRRIVGNDADADDATQEALIAICRGITKFDGRAAFSTWIYRVATNACLDELRRKSRRPVATDDAALPVAAAPDAFADQVGTRLELEAALAQLSPDFRAAVVLRDLCQLDYDEIAAVLNIPGGTVRSRIARARGQLVTLLPSRNQSPTYERPSRPE